MKIETEKIQYGQLKPEHYIQRLADSRLSELLGLFGAVEVAGTMWCGKTWTSLAHGSSVARLGDEAERIAAQADPVIALSGEGPHVIDEWQDVPAVWDAVRNAVDASGSRPGQFILTGSSRPKEDVVRHSGAGRIARLHMHTMTLAESGMSSGKVSLAGLFEQDFQTERVNQGLEPIAEAICRGGWPALIAQNRADAGEYLANYFEAIFDVSIPRLKMNGEESRRVAMSVARNTGNALRLKTVAEDAGFTEIDQKSATTKVSAHIAVLERLYVMEALRGWDAPVRAKKRLRTKPKYYFADPSLTASLLGVTPNRLVKDGNLFGVLFESLCIHELSSYAALLPQAKQTPLAYYHDADGLETDAVLELRDGRWAAFEIKLGENGIDSAAHALNRLKKKICANPAAHHPEPEFLAVLVGAGTTARFDKERGVYVIPITTLGP